MPYKKKARTKPSKYGKGKKMRTYKTGRRKKEGDYNYAKLRCVGMPYNMYTFLRLASTTRNHFIPMPGAYANPAPLVSYWQPTSTSYALGYNMLTPINLQTTIGQFGTPYNDIDYFGPPNTTNILTPPVPKTQLNTWSQLTWWANWFQKMRITHVWVKIQIRPNRDSVVPEEIKGNQPTNPNSPVTQSVSSTESFSVTYLESKYIPGLNTPELLATKDYDDLRATKGAKTWVVNGYRNKPLVIKRKISVAKLLGVKDLEDVDGSENVIYPTMTTTDLNNKLLRNPATTEDVFGFIRVSRQAIPQSDPNLAIAYSIQIDLTAKVHLYQLQLNNPQSVTGSAWPPAGPARIETDPNYQPPTPPMGPM